MKYYAGIGSRQTPPDILLVMTAIATYLQKRGYVLRSGGADGADTAFQEGAGVTHEIYLPWEGFNNRRGIVCGQDKWLRWNACLHHPKWETLSPAAKCLHTRNVAQVLGLTVDSPISEFVVCWTPDGEGDGGTGQAIRIAGAHNIPVYDLARTENVARLHARFEIERLLS